MNPAPADDAPVFTLTDDSLFQLQLGVARRADELARERPPAEGGARDRETWGRAEDEMFSAWPRAAG